jgi:hypothetical protein
VDGQQERREWGEDANRVIQQRIVQVRPPSPVRRHTAQHRGPTGGEYAECRPAETAGRAVDVPRSQSFADWAALWDVVVRRKHAQR